MSKSNTNQTNKLNQTLVAHGGRFTTLNISNKSKRERVCAKILKVTDSYVTFFDVNAKKQRKVSRSSIVIA